MKRRLRKTNKLYKASNKRRTVTKGISRKERIGNKLFPEKIKYIKSGHSYKNITDIKDGTTDMDYRIGRMLWKDQI